MVWRVGGLDRLTIPATGTGRTSPGRLLCTPWYRVSSWFLFSLFFAATFRRFAATPQRPCCSPLYSPIGITSPTPGTVDCCVKKIMPSKIRLGSVVSGNHGELYMPPPDPKNPSKRRRRRKKTLTGQVAYSCGDGKWKVIWNDGTHGT